MNERKLPIIPHSRPTIGSAESRGVAAVIRSGHLAQGKMVQAFEQAFTERMMGAASAAVGSGTAALHLVLLAMGVGMKDEVIIPSYVCSALLNAVRYVDAKPVLADIDPDTGNIDPGDAEKRITRRTKAIIVPHMFGLAADLNGLAALGVPVIEDCAQAVGGTFAGKPVGTIGRAAVFSFYATKVMTTGEGGMVVSGSKELIKRIKDLREYDGTPDYKIRYNYKMTDIAAAMGLAQLEKLDSFIRRRRRVARQYDDFLAGLDVKRPPADPGHIYFRYVVELSSGTAAVLANLRKMGVMGARPVFRPLHRYLKQKGFINTDRAWQNSLSLPIYPGLARNDADRVLSAFMESLQGVGR